MLDFSVYQGTELNDLGTLAQSAGAKGTLAFIPKNLLSAKRVVIVIKKKNGESATLSCSLGISDSVRKAIEGGMPKAKILAALSKLHILEGDSEIPYLCAPAGEGAGLEEFVVETLAKDATATYEALVAF